MNSNLTALMDLLKANGRLVPLSTSAPSALDMSVSAAATPAVSSGATPFAAAGSTVAAPVSREVQLSQLPLTSTLQRNSLFAVPRCVSPVRPNVEPLPQHQEHVDLVRQEQVGLLLKHPETYPSRVKPAFSVQFFAHTPFTKIHNFCVASRVPSLRTPRGGVSLLLHLHRVD
jgi:hypothetical protein